MAHVVRNTPAARVALSVTRLPAHIVLLATDAGDIVNGLLWWIEEVPTRGRIVHVSVHI